MENPDKLRPLFKAGHKPPPQPGSIGRVGKWFWASVLNPDPISSLNNSFEYGDTCGCKEGGQLTVLGLSGSDLVVEYTTPENESVGGSPCPSGTIFRITKDEFLWQDNTYHKMTQDKEEDRAKMRELLKGFKEENK